MQNASLDVADLLATNGVLHVLSQVRLGGVYSGNRLCRLRGSDILTSPMLCDKVLLPPRRDVPGGQGLLQQLDSVPAFHLFRELLQVRARGAFMVGAPFPRCRGGWWLPGQDRG